MSGATLSGVRARVQRFTPSWLFDFDWPILAAIFVIYSQLPDAVRPMDADLLLTAGVGIALIRALVHGATLAWIKPALVCVAVYWAVAMSSVAWAGDQSKAIAAAIRLSKDLTIFLAMAVCILPGRVLRRASWAVTSAGLLTTVVPIFQHVTGRFDDRLWGFGNVKFESVLGDLAGYRVAGTMDDPNYFAQSLLPILAVGFGLAWTSRGWWARALAAWACVAALGCIVLTYSRGAMVALAVLLPLLVVFNRPIGRSGAYVALLVLSAVPFSSQVYVERVKTFGMFAPGRQHEVLTEPGFSGRTSEMLAGLRMFRDHPLGGVGLGNYEVLYRRYAAGIGIDRRREDREAHSLPIEVAAETGLVGVVAFGSLLGMVLIRVARAWRHAPAGKERSLVVAIGVGLVGYLASSLFLHDAYQRQLWIVAGLAYAASGADSPPRDPHAPVGAADQHHAGAGV